MSGVWRNSWHVSSLSFTQVMISDGIERVEVKLLKKKLQIYSAVPLKPQFEESTNKLYLVVAFVSIDDDITWQAVLTHRFDHGDFQKVWLFSDRVSE